MYETYKKKFQVSEKCDIKCDFYALFHEVYCYITSGVKVDLILQPLVHRMKKDLKKYKKQNKKHASIFDAWFFTL